MPNLKYDCIWLTWSLPSEHSSQSKGDYVVTEFQIVSDEQCSNALLLSPLACVSFLPGRRSRREDRQVIECAARRQLGGCLPAPIFVVVGRTFDRLEDAG